MNPTFVEIVFAVPNSTASVKRLIALGTLGSVSPAANGRALVTLLGAAAFPVGAGGTQLQTYEAYGDVVARVASATPASPTATVSSADAAKAESNRQADAQAASTTTPSSS